MKRRLIFILFFALINLIFSQQNDDVGNLSYYDFHKEIRKFDTDDTAVFKYIIPLIQKAKKEKDYWELYYAYGAAAEYSSKEKRITYADSGLWAANFSKDSTLLGRAFLSKGLRLNGNRVYDQALENYLIAEKYLHSSSDAYAKHKLLLSIGQLKNYLGMFDEAIPMIDSANRYYSKLQSNGDTIFYLYSLNALKDINVQLGNYTTATQQYYQGKQLNAIYQDDVLEALLDLYEGFNLYEQKEYRASINIISNSLPRLYRKEDFSRIAMADYYLGMNYLALGEEEKGILFLKKMDSIYTKENFTRPRFRKGYEALINHFEKEKNTQEQLWAINQLLAVDSTLNAYYKGLGSQLKKEYDTALLLREKKSLEKSATTQNLRYLYIIVGLILFCIAMMFLAVKSQKTAKKYKETYKSILEKLENKPKESILPEEQKEEILVSEETMEDEKTINESQPSETQSNSLAESVVTEILAKLKKFEQQNGFLDGKLTQAKLAKKLGTNTTYLSTTINQEKGKGFSEYLNTLRIEYLLNYLHDNPTARKYTLDALASTAGYNNTKTFKKAFYTEKEIPAKRFIADYAKEPIT